MAFINDNGENISYECSELIEELKHDIAEFGSSKIVAVWYKEDQGTTIYTNYDYITEDQPIDESELESGEYLKEMTMGALLSALEAQNTML